jgi:tripartite-type tricarboxylate transporter receptor subunit TctC
MDGIVRRVSLMLPSLTRKPLFVLLALLATSTVFAQPIAPYPFGGQIQLMFATSVAVRPHLKAGRLRTLAVTSGKRSATLPDVPTVAEAGVPGYEVSAFNGVVVPAGTPAHIVTKLASDIGQSLKSPDVPDRFAADGAEAVGSTPQDFACYLRDEIQKWTKVIAAAGIKAE